MRFCLLIFVLSVAHTVSGQDRKIDSLTTFVQAYLQVDTIRVNALNDLSREYLWIDYQRAIQFADEAVKISRQLNFLKGLANACNVKGFCYWALGDNDLAIQISMEAANIGEEINSPSILGESLMVLSRAYTDLGEYAKGYKCINEAEQFLSQTNDWDQISSLYNWRGVLYSLNDKPDSAKVFYEMALEVAKKHNLAQINFPRIISNIGECYLDNKPDTAFAYFDRALALARETNNRTAEASISSIMGRAYLRFGDLKKSEEHLLIGLKLARELGLRRTIRSVYGGMVKLKLQEGKTTEAMEYMKRQYEVRDSLLNTAKARQIVELEAKHELEKRQQAIEMLEQEKRIQTIWRNVLIGGVLAILLFSYFIFHLQRSRARKAKELLALQELLNDQLKETDKLKTDFFNNISHEFRTPLTLILAPLENVMKKRTSREDSESLSLIKRNAQRLLELVNQLLDISKLESGKMELHIQAGDLNQFVNVLASSFDSLSEHKTIPFNKRIELSQSCYFFDEDKIEKIITNLLSNAFKYTPSGGIVTLEVSDSDLAIRISVSDTGPGIPEEQQAKIFAPFYQVKHGDRQLGTGLGLSLVRELVKLYKGTIQLESKIGLGSTFTIVLPADPKAFKPEHLVPGDPKAVEL